MKKNILITGASGNLGKVAVEKFMEKDYRVITTVSPGKTLGYPVTDDVHVYEGDLTNEKAVQEVIAEIIRNHQTIDGALLLVGAYASGRVKETDSAALKKMLALNFETAYNVVRPVFQQMLTQGGGRIVFVGSRPALNAKEGKRSVAYALAKTLVFSLADILNAEGAEKNVVSSVIVPSTIDTPANRDAMPDADFSSWVKPEDIAEAMVYLVSDAGRALRNTVLKIYGNA